jgi:tetratricopeptide (TPR) repeat protein
MIFLSNLPGMLAFRTRALRAQAEQRALAGGMVCFAAGFWAFVLVWNSVNPSLPELSSPQSLLVGTFFNFYLIQIILFSILIYIPAIIILSAAISGDGIGLSISGREYYAHISVLLPLWGMLFLIAASIQWLASALWEIHAIEISVGMSAFGEIPVIGIPIGMPALLILLPIYTLWAIQKLNYLSAAQSVGVLVLSWFALPIDVILIYYLYALPFFLIIPLIYFGSQWIRGYFASQTNERAFQQNLHALTINPQDADAHYQLGLIHLKRRNPDAARKCFEKAIGIDAGDPDYHYSLGRVFELEEEWGPALEQYEATYRLNPEYRLRDIFREVGKGYLNTGNIDRGIEFLNHFLAKRSSDPEGRYWLAIALKKSGNTEQMRYQLHTIVQQARANPGFFRKEHREWVYRARMMIRDSS